MSQTGIFQVNPNEGNSDGGFDLSLGSTGVYIPLEFGWLPARYWIIPRHLSRGSLPRLVEKDFVPFLNPNSGCEPF